MQLPSQLKVLVRTQTKCWEHPSPNLLLPLLRYRPTRRFTSGNRLFREWGQIQHSKSTNLRSRKNSNRFTLSDLLSWSPPVWQCKPGWGSRTHPIRECKRDMHSRLVQVEWVPAWQCVRLLSWWSVLKSNYSRNSSHNLINVHLAVVIILGEGCLIKHFLDILHSVGAWISWQWARLSHRVNVSHVPDRWSHNILMVANNIVDFLVCGERSWHQVIFVLVRIVRSTSVK